MKLQKKQFKWIGLFVAVILPVILSTSALWRDPKDVIPSITGGAISCLPLLFLFLILKFGEKEPISSLGKVKINVKTIGLSLVLVIIMLAGTFLFGYVMRILNILPGQENMYNQMKLLPVWGKILLVIWAGVSEEFYFRGYAITRLRELTGNKIIAVVLPLLIFGLGHAGDKSLYHVLFATFIGLILTISYLKTKNLLANIMAHALLDFIFLVILS
jgi:uncharacterized protein